MKYYLAPLEGVTTYIYRRAYHNCFDSMDKYFTPFIVPHQNKTLNSRELNDILPEHNKDMVTIPQVLTNCSEDFIRLAKELKQFGYNEVNLNLGCPSGTVVAKGKGSGFLAKKEELDAFLYHIFEAVDMKISIKTRIGKESPEEFYSLIEIFNKYSMEELIIHPRIQKDFYKNTPNLSVFSDAITLSKNKLCYNGDIFTKSNYEAFTKQFPSVNTIMLGRGIIANPSLICQIQKGEFIGKEQLRQFHDMVYHEYREVMSGDRNVLFKMKELWFYMIHLFSNYEKYAKKIKKSEKCFDYEKAINCLFEEQEIVVR